MIKADYIYTKKERLVQTVSPIMTQTNALCAISNIIHNSLKTDALLKNVSTTFNNYKYSLFIPIINSMINKLAPYVNIDILTLFNNNLRDTDYIYSNVIGPSTNDLDKKVSNIHFLLTSIKTEIIYNIISSENDINIICSFKKGIIENKKLFERCIYKAYNNIMY